MKTIAIFTGYYLPHLGGIERYIDNLTKELNKLGFKVIIITSNYNDSLEEEYVDDTLILRLPIFNIFRNRYPIYKFSYKKVLDKLNNYNIDSIIVNTRFHLISHIGAIYGKRKKIPVYLIEHGSDYITLDNKLIDFFANRYEDILTLLIKNKIKGFYGVSKRASDWLVNFGINSKGVWYNSIDTNMDLPRKRLNKDKVTFLYAGRILKQKGVENILISFSKLEKQYNNLILYIAGDGPELNKYKEKYISPNIIFLGKLDKDELFKYYAKTDIFLFPTLYPEGLPTSLLEAGLMKCAVIATDKGGIKEVINSKNGIIVAPNERSLFAGMARLIKDKNLREKYALELNKTVKENFSWEITTKKIVKDMGFKYEK